jgi:hypothetical protein
VTVLAEKIRSETDLFLNVGGKLTRQDRPRARESRPDCGSGGSGS